MRTYIVGLATLLLIGSVTTAMQNRKGGEDETGPYVVVDKWMKPFAKTGTCYSPTIFPHYLFQGMVSVSGILETNRWMGISGLPNLACSRNRHAAG